MNQRLMDGLITDSTTCLYELIELNSTEHKLVEEVRDYILYINEHMLWIASAEPLSFTDVQYIPGVVHWFFEREEWVGVKDAVLLDVSYFWLVYIAILLTFIALVFLSRRMKQSVLDIGDRVQQRGYHRFWPTLQALLLTILIAIIFPLPMWLFGWRLSVSHLDTKLARALGGGFMLAGRVFLLLMLIRHVCRAKGLAGAHFGWTDKDLGLLRKYVRWLALSVVPLLLFAGLLQHQENQQWRNSLGRICFILSTIILTVFAFRLLRPKTGLLYQLSVARSAEWITKMRYVWFILGVSAPVTVAVLARRSVGRHRLLLHRLATSVAVGGHRVVGVRNAVGKFPLTALVDDRSTVVGLVSITNSKRAGRHR